MESTRVDVEFVSSGSHCRGWRFRPAQPRASRNPCIVMAHGLGGTRDAALEPYARVFSAAGFDVLLFDYRHFGASEGEPRQLISVRRQLQDWTAAIDYARSLPEVDPTRIALWGTSFSGGHVLVAAARDGRVAAVCSQGPMADGLAAALNVVHYAGLIRFLKLGALGALDLLKGVLKARPLYIPLVAPPGGLAMMSTADAEPGYRRLAPPHWRNEASARTALLLPLYRPLRHAAQLPCPTLMLVCREDSVAPATAAVAAARRARGRIELKEYQDLGHFDLYHGAGFDRSCADQLAFLERTLNA